MQCGRSTVSKVFLGGAGQGSAECSKVGQTPQKIQKFLPNIRGANLHEAFKLLYVYLPVCPPYVSIWVIFVLHS